MCSLLYTNAESLFGDTIEVCHGSVLELCSFVMQRVFPDFLMLLNIAEQSLPV